MSRWPEYRAAFNRTNLEHLGYALLMQAAVALLTWGNWIAGAAFGFAFFLGREHAQAQRNLNLGDFRAFDFRLWSRDSQLDLAMPTLGVAVVAGIAYCF